MSPWHDPDLNDRRGPPSIEELQTEQLWDQFAANVLLTVQAFQRLHTALDEKFTR